MRPITCLCLLLLVSSASADTITEINLAVDPSGYAAVEERMVFDSAGDYGLAPMPAYAGDLIVSDEKGILNHTLAEVGGVATIKVPFRSYLQSGGTREVSIRYGTHYLTSKEGGMWRVNYVGPASPRKTIMKVKLPEGSEVKMIQPSETLRTYVADGVWIYPQEDSFNVSILYQYGAVYNPPANETGGGGGSGFKPDVRFFYGIVLIAVVLLLLYMLYSLYKNRLLMRDATKEPLTVKVEEDIVESKIVDGRVSYGTDSSASPGGARRIKESVLKVLDEKELTVVRLLENSDDDEVTQAYIYKTTGIPKSSLSDVLRQMEKRNILERRSEGRVKWIKLKKWVLE